MREFLLISDFYIFPYTNGHVIINLYDNEILFTTEVTVQRSGIIGVINGLSDNN